MKTTLYIVRHGHSMGNLTKTFYGHYDGELTDVGHAQAKRVAEYFKDKAVDAVYSSDLRRAVNTVKPTADAKSLTVIGDKRLREIYAGKWENRKIAELLEEYPTEYDIWRNDKANSVCTDGESVRELQKRIFDAVTDIATKNDGKSIVVATHATPIWTLKPSFLNLPLESMNGSEYVPNASITVTVYENGRWTLDTYGECMHLEGMVTTMDKLF